MKTDRYISWDRMCVYVCVSLYLYVVVIHCKYTIKWASLVDQMVKNLPVMQETPV